MRNFILYLILNFRKKILWFGKGRKFLKKYQFYFQIYFSGISHRKFNYFLYEVFRFWFFLKWILLFKWSNVENLPLRDKNYFINVFFNQRRYSLRN